MILEATRAIAGLAGEEYIVRAHVLEVLRYRNLDGGYWKQM